MSERDELAAVITNAYLTKSNLPSINGHAPVDEPIADAILAAGYRKPRTITTAEELDALPNYSIVQTGRSTCWVKSKVGEFCWESTAGHMGSTNKGLDFPATVLWEPK